MLTASWGVYKSSNVLIFAFSASSINYLLTMNKFSSLDDGRLVKDFILGFSTKDTDSFFILNLDDLIGTEGSSN